MNRLLGLSLGVLSLAIACRRQEPEPSHEVADPQSQGVVVDEGCPHMKDGECHHGAAEVEEPSPGGLQVFGQPLGSSPTVALSRVLENPSEFHDKRVVVEGHVSRACSRKGCWMEIAVSDKADAPRCRVTFENYGFFVPRDSAGSHAKLEGLVQVTQVKPEAVEHYESEGAKFPEKSADGSAQEVRFIATGVELERI